MDTLKKLHITKTEIIIDTIILIVALTISLLAIFIFDIHWSFYPGNTVFPPSKRIFTSLTPYLIGAPIGTLVGFLLIKLLVFAFMKAEEEFHKEDKKNSITLKIKKGRTYAD